MIHTSTKRIAIVYYKGLIIPGVLNNYKITLDILELEVHNSRPETHTPVTRLIHLNMMFV